MIDDTQAQFIMRGTNDALLGKTVIGIYFSADWCGPCRKFTPELVQFYEKMNKKHRNTFEIVWVSRCRDVESFAQYFTHMPWLALRPEEAMGQRGQMLSQKYHVKGIPSLVLIDEYGSTITTDARNKVPQDRAGVGFPWRNPIATMYITILPRSLRLLLKTQVQILKKTLLDRLRSLLPIKF
jgi:nucleoredoxin